MQSRELVCYELHKKDDDLARRLVDSIEESLNVALSRNIFLLVDLVSVVRSPNWLTHEETESNDEILLVTGEAMVDTFRNNN